MLRFRSARLRVRLRSQCEYRFAFCSCHLIVVGMVLHVAVNDVGAGSEIQFAV